MTKVLEISHPNVNSGAPYALPWLGSPLNLPEIVSETINTTLSNDIYVDHFNVKKSISNTFDYLTIDEYEALFEYVQAQRTYGTFCSASLLKDGMPYQGWDDLIAYLSMSTLSIIDDCETVNNVTIVLRETEEEDNSTS